MPASSELHSSSSTGFHGVIFAALAGIDVGNGNFFPKFDIASGNQV